ncbi:MAG: flavodoxin family protein [Methanosarcinales archaeon]|jgi:multimeric flavodoxin WrbA|nr:flavodoxin family protein [Methanosarcinales archaeon]
MKIIGITASPREKGNTATLIQKSLDAAAAKGAETEYINLSKLTIHPCKGCNYCKAHDTCVQKDDFASVAEKIVSADGILMGSPVYFFDITAQAKIFIDRLYACVDSAFKSRVPPGKKIGFIYSQNTPDRNAFGAHLDKYNQVAGMLGIAAVGKFVSVGDVSANPAEIDGAVEIAEKLF